MQPTKRFPDSDWAATTVDTALAVFQSCRKYQTMLSGRLFESDLQSELATQLSRDLGQLWLATTSAHYLEPVAKPTTVEAWPADFVVAWNGLRSWTTKAIEQLHFQPIAENLMLVIRLGDESKEIESGGIVKRWYRTGDYTWPRLTDTDVRPLAFVIKELRRAIDAYSLTPSPLEVKRQVFLNAEKLGFKSVTFSQEIKPTSKTIPPEIESTIRTPEIAERYGVTSDAVRKWSSPTKPPFPDDLFPKAINPNGRPKVYPLSEVFAWMNRHPSLGARKNDLT